MAADFIRHEPPNQLPVVNEEDANRSTEESRIMAQLDQAAVDAESRLFASYTNLIRKKGITSTQTEMKARQLGIDVDALLAERDQKIQDRKVIEIRLDLATLAAPPNETLSPDSFNPWESKLISPATAALTVNLPGLGIYGMIELNPTAETRVADLLSAGVNLILSKLRNHPDEYRHTLPWGIKDIVLDRLVFSDSRKTWSLQGGRKPAALERTSRSLHPSRSIDLARTTVREAPRVKARPWPELGNVWLRIDQWPSGALHFVDAFETRDEAGPDRVSTHPEQPGIITLKYPSPGKFRWNEFWTTKPATHFLKAHSFRQAGILAKDADRLGVEAIVCDYSIPVPAKDFRSSMRSGLHGPAPVPEGMAWPVCRNCDEIPSFWESLDFRDVGFHHLLPGTMLSIFVCDRCLEAGEPSLGTTLIWLPADESVELISKGDPMPLLEARQWIDRDCSKEDIPTSLAVRIETEWPEDLPCGLISVAQGSKAGGLPFFLQEDPTLFDADGCLMDYIGQFTPPESCWFGGYGYLFHSATTGETMAEFQST